MIKVKNAHKCPAIREEGAIGFISVANLIQIFEIIGEIINLKEFLLCLKK